MGPCCFLRFRPSRRKCSLFGLRPKACSLWRLNSCPPSVTVGPRRRAFLPLLRLWGAGFSVGDTGANSFCAVGLSGWGCFPQVPLDARSCPCGSALSLCGFPVASVGVSVSSGQSDLKICLFFHEFWAFWLYAFLSCSSSCSDLWVPSGHACHLVLWEMPMHACCPSSQTPGPAPPRHLYMQVFFREHHRFSSLSSAARICRGRERGPAA